MTRNNSSLMSELCANATMPVEFDDADRLKLLLYSVIFVFSLLGNATMLLVLVRNLRVSGRRVHLLLLHMNVADLCFTLLFVAKRIVHIYFTRWLWGDWLCRASKAWDTFGVYLSSNLLICISVDRYFSISSPFYTFKADKLVRNMITTAYIVAALSSLPNVFLFKKASHPCFASYTQCVSRSFLREIDFHYELYNTLLNALEIYLVPFVVICACCAGILFNVTKEDKNRKRLMFAKSSFGNHEEEGRKSSRRQVKSEKARPTRGKSKMVIKQQFSTMTDVAGRAPRSVPLPHKSLTVDQSLKQLSEPTRRRRQAATEVINKRQVVSLSRAKSKTLRMALVMIVTFLVCWTPYFLAASLHFIDLDYSTGKRRNVFGMSRTVASVCNAFAAANSCINPYLYGWISFDIRKELKALLFANTANNRRGGTRSRSSKFTNTFSSTARARLELLPNFT